jgi:hypothetical protein
VSVEIATKICYVCGVEKSLVSFGKYYNQASPSLRRNICEQCRKNRHYHNLRFAFLKHFDFKCQCCGITEIRFLTIDHVQNDGHKDSHLTPIQVYRKAFEESFDKDKWNCLCWNCNCARSQNGGICPHKDSVTEQMFLERYARKTDYKARFELAQQARLSKKLEDVSNLVTSLSKEEITQLMEVLRLKSL